MGPGAGEDGGQVVTAGTPTQVADSQASRTAPHLASFLASEPPADRLDALRSQTSLS
jgi:excinuclease ABC subunit A